MSKKDDHATEKARRAAREPGLEDFGLQAALLALALASVQGAAREDAAEAPPAADCPLPASSQVAGGQGGAEPPGAGPAGPEVPFWPGTAPADTPRRSIWRHHWVSG